MTSALPMRRPSGFHAPRHAPARVQRVIPKRAEERLAVVALRFFPESKLLPGSSARVGTMHKLG